MTPKDFIDKYGHRDPHECEILHPRPKEDDQWLMKQLQEYKDNPS